MPTGSRVLKHKYISKKKQSPINKSTYIRIQHIIVKFSRKSKITMIFQISQTEKITTQKEMLKYYRRRQQFIKILLKRTNHKFIVYDRLIDVYLNTNQYTKALNGLQECLKWFLSPFYQQIIYHYLGAACYNLMRYEQAAINYKKSIQRTQISFRSNEMISFDCWMLGEIFTHLGKQSQAAFYYKECLKISPQHYKAKKGLSRIYQRDEQLEANLTYQREDKVYLYEELSDYYFHKQEYSSAIIFCLHGIRIYPLQKYYYLTLAEAYQNQQQYARSYYYYQKALEINPFLSMALNGIGQIQLELGQLECAINYFIQAIKAYPNDQSPYINFKLIFDQQYDKRQKITQLLLQLQKQVNINNSCDFQFAMVFKFIGNASKYYQNFSYITQHMEQDILPYNPFLLTAIQMFQTFYNLGFDEFSENFILDMGLLYKLVNNQKQGTKYYETAINQIQKIYKQQSRFEIFRKIYKAKMSPISDDHYRVLVCYFVISQMFKQDGYEAMKSVIWLFNIEPSAEYQPLFAQLVYRHQTKNIESAFIAYQFVNKLLGLNDENFDEFLLHSKEQNRKINNQVINFQAKLIDSLQKCKKCSKKYISFMLHLKGDKIGFQLKKLLNFAASQGLKLKRQYLPENIYSQIFMEPDHTQFIRQFCDLSPNQKRYEFAKTFVCKSIIILELVKFVCNLLAIYFQFRKVQPQRFVTLLKEIKNKKVFNFSQFKMNVQKCLNNSLGQNSKMETFSFNLAKPKSNIISQVENISSMDSNLFEQSFEKEDRFYLTIKYQSIPFHTSSSVDNSKKYFQFKRLLFKNLFLLPQYLSINNKKLNHIIKYFVHDCWDQSSHENGFKIEMEKGEEANTGAIRKSREKTYAWIIGIAQSIIDIQSKGIFHADIEFRNTVSVQGTFKMIDFGYAFKFKLVEGQTQQLSIYQNTIKIIEESLRFAFDQAYSVFEFLFGQIDKDQQHKYFISKLVKSLQGLDPKKRLIKCLDELLSNSKIMHLRSYCKLVEQLLESVSRQNGQETLKQLQLKQISLQMQILRQNNKTLEEYIKCIKKIRTTNS